jgi:DNA repair ATPase RecN
MRLVLAFLALAASASAQQAPMSDEEVVAVFNRISQRAARLGPMLEQLNPSDWVAKGAPDTYVAQWNSVRQQYAAIQNELSDLSHHLDHMTDSMKALFRIEAANQALGSLLGGARKYQNPAVAELIESVAAESARDIDSFQQHLIEMADAKEQQLALVDREAQRCRATLSKEPAQAPRAPRRAQ